MFNEGSFEAELQIIIALQSQMDLTNWLQEILKGIQSYGKI